MRKPVAWLCLAATGCLFAGARALACGDKPLRLGRHVRSQRAHGAVQRGSILLLLDPGGHLQGALREMGLERDLGLAGHTLRIVSSPRDLVAEIRRGGHDILIADIAEVAALDPGLLATPGSPTVLPVVVNATGDEWAETVERFSCISRSPSAGQHHLAVIEEVLVQRRTQKRRKEDE